ncbi:MAG: chloride channel protein, partial [Solirubrobacterales bacterium]
MTDASVAPPPGSDAPAGPNVPQVSPQLVGLAVVLGVVGAVAAATPSRKRLAATELVWTTLPQELGFGEPPDWWVFAALIVAALFVFAAWRLPGHTGKGPLSGLHFDLDQRTAPSFLLAALGTLIFGAVLGPEAPLIALGTGLGALIFARKGGPAKQLGMLLTGGAAIGSIFGSPFLTAFLFLEFAAFGALPAIALVPLFVALASGYIVEIGINHFAGFGTHSLAVPGIPPYDQLLVVDLLGGGLLDDQRHPALPGEEDGLHRLAGDRPRHHSEQRGQERSAEQYGGAPAAGELLDPGRQLAHEDRDRTGNDRDDHAAEQVADEQLVVRGDTGHGERVGPEAGEVVESDLDDVAAGQRYEERHEGDRRKRPESGELQEEEGGDERAAEDRADRR